LKIRTTDIIAAVVYMSDDRELTYTEVVSYGDGPKIYILLKYYSMKISSDSGSKLYFYFFRQAELGKLYFD